MTIDERFCVTVQAISPVQEIGISHLGQEVFVIEPDRQHAIVVQCLSAERERVLAPFGTAVEQSGPSLFSHHGMDTAGIVDPGSLSQYGDDDGWTVVPRKSNDKGKSGVWSGAEWTEWNGKRESHTNHPRRLSTALSSPLEKQGKHTGPSSKCCSLTVHSLSLQVLLGTALLRRTSHRAALGAPRGSSLVCLGCVFFSLESGGVDSALSRVALLDTDVLPPPSGLLTVALLPLIFLLDSCVCILMVGRVV